MSDIFGVRSSYTKLSEIEQEFLDRMVASQNFVIHILGWGYVENPRVKFGDLRLGLEFRLNFVKPENPVPVHYFDLELRTRSGILLFKERQSCMYDGKPVLVGAGLFFDLAWDIAITAIDPKLIKMVMPNTLGLTSRFIDKDSKEVTLYGNTALSSKDKKHLERMRVAEMKNKQDTQAKALTATKREKDAGIVKK
jgi:hypothetical protein